MRKKSLKQVNNERSSVKVFGLAGNPNVGKSTVFNSLTGLRQHTGNWPGKTVSNAIGQYQYKKEIYEIYDLPGTYSLISHSKEEECARDFICFSQYDGIIVVCDAVNLERNLNLVLQVLEVTSNVIVVVNLMDEAKKKKIKIDLEKLSKIVGVPVVGATARSKKGLEEIMDEASKIHLKRQGIRYQIVYDEEIETAIHMLENGLNEVFQQNKIQKNMKEINTRWIALSLLIYGNSFQKIIVDYLEYDFISNQKMQECITSTKLYLSSKHITDTILNEKIVSAAISDANKIAQEVVTFENKKYQNRDKKIDYILTSKWTGIPIMILLLMGIFWLTIVGANYPSDLLFDFFQWIGENLSEFLMWIHAPTWFQSMLVDGIYRVLTWVVSVMLPPMAIFFPLFTLLEDLGYLPRIAFNLDHCFKKCNACGKQSLTMCMGFGCNAAGVVGCRIIDSPRERLIAILTNNFVPCNGRFPTIIAIITMFFVGFHQNLGSSLLNVFLLTITILIGISMTFLVSKILSKTILKGLPSSFTLELPPYRRPQVGQVIVRSILDRTVYVLGRAILIAAPAGLIIWLFANMKVGNISILKYCTNFLNPFASLIGMDGTILMAFLLGFPANEIVVPIMMMAYLSQGTLVESNSLFALREILVQNGWTWLTAVSTILFSLMHFPCSTTCLTIKKETGSWKWTLLSIILPTTIGFGICFLLTTIVRLLGLV